MLDAKHSSERKINHETLKLIGKNQLHQYGIFSDTFNKRLTILKNKFLRTSKINNTYNETVSVELACDEDVTLLNLVSSNNKLLSQMLASLASICQEMGIIVKESEEMYKHFLFYEETNQTELHDQTFLFVQNNFKNLQKISSIVDRSQKVITLLLHQLNALIGKEFYTSNNGPNFAESIDYLADLLVCLIFLDNLVNEPIIEQHCSYYLMVVQNLLHDPRRFNFSTERLKFLQKNIQEIQNKLLSGRIFKDSISIATSSSKISPSASSEFTAYINELLLELYHDEDSIFFTQLWLQANALVVFQWSLFGDVDRKSLKKLTDLNKKVGSCTIIGNKLWYPEEFLTSQLPSSFKYASNQVTTSRTTQITTKSHNLLKETNSLISQACFSIISIEKMSKQDMKNLELKNIQEATKILVETMKLLKKISVLVKWVIRIHADQNLPIGKSTLITLFRLIEILKCYQLTFSRNSLSIIYITMLISQHLTYKTLSMINGIRKNLVQDKTYKQKQLDVLSAVSVCEHAMRGCTTKERLLIAKLALSAGELSKETFLEIKRVLNCLELYHSLDFLFKKMCDCTFLYEHSNTFISTYFAKLHELNTDISRYHLLLLALDECANIGQNKAALFEDSLRKHFSAILIQNVETNLRLQTHLHLASPPSQPFPNYLSFCFKKLPYGNLKNMFFDIGNETEHSLSANFYNLTTVVLHDWQTYGEMRRLAFHQYKLETVEDNLPMQTIEQGLDVLEIMRNINVFVSKYLYNLNLQVFIEEKSNNKHLNTINISHIANSIRTHGIGIMNTAVNYTYQFLQRKFFIFSQFMFDEQIKSRLLKDLRYFSEHKSQLGQMYPYERAEKFNHGIRRLGLDENGQSYLDLFRKLISHIGNAMGYVRLIRSGGRRCLAEGTCFIPDFQKVDNISKYFSKDVPQLVEKAASFFTHDLETLTNNFEEATEYFKLLVDVFVPIFRDQKHVHLKNFFIIVPPLMINFVEHSLTCKEKLNKKNKDEAAFTDDGFAMGIAFIIEILEQDEQVNSLHWFDSVHAKLSRERTAIQFQRTKGNKEDYKLQQTLSLSERRIATYEREFGLLYYNYKSARIFFQSL